MSSQPHACSTRTVVIVDPVVDDYNALVASRRADNSRFFFFDTGEAAVRLSAPANAVWLINVDLPDMPGPDLTRLLRGRTDRPTVCLIGDQYDFEDELAARCCGAALYLCKPLSPQWFLHLGDITSTRDGQRFDLEPRPPTRCRDSPALQASEPTAQTLKLYATHTPLRRRQGEDQDEHHERIFFRPAQRRVAADDGDLRRHTDPRIDRS